MATSFVYADIAEDGSLVEAIETIEALQEYITKVEPHFPVNIKHSVVLANEYAASSTHLAFPIPINELTHQLNDLDFRATCTKCEQDKFESRVFETIDDFVAEWGTTEYLTVSQVPDLENVYVVFDSQTGKHGSFSLPVKQSVIADILLADLFN